jgi:CRP-like cAMP-binding protein
MDQPITLETVVRFLVETPLFDRLDAAERAEVARIMEIERLVDGEQVFREGDSGDAWYVIFEGQASVLKHVEDGQLHIAVLERGSCFGEMAILDGQARSASVIAQGPLTVFRFRRARFEELLDEGSLGAYKLVLGMARMLSQRHRNLTQTLSDLASSGALVAIGGDSTGSATARPNVAEYQISE